MRDSATMMSLVREIVGSKQKQIIAILAGWAIARPCPSRLLVDGIACE